MRNQILIIVALIFISFSINAQERYFDERYVYTQNHLFPVLINPGAIGSSGDHELLFNYRNNWSSFEGSPKSLTFSYNGSLGNRLGFGASLFKDSYGALETTKGMLGLSYTIESPINKLGFGITTEYVEHGLGGTSFVDVNIEDPIVRDRLDGAQFFDITFGINGQYNEKISYGVVFPSLVSSRLSEENNTGSDREIGFILHGAYDYHAQGNGIHIIPSVFIKRLMNVPTHVDLNLRMTFLEEKLTSGVSYTLGADKRLGFLIGTKIEKVGFYYSYNVSNEDFQDYNNGAHEITLSLNLSSTKPMDKGL